MIQWSHSWAYIQTQLQFKKMHVPAMFTAALLAAAKTWACVCVFFHFSHVRLFSSLWTVAHQEPQSMDSPGKNTGLGCHVLLQGIFPTQESNPHLLHCRWILSHWATWEAHQNSNPSFIEHCSKCFACIWHVYC